MLIQFIIFDIDDFSTQSISSSKLSCSPQLPVKWLKLLQLKLKTARPICQRCISDRTVTFCGCCQKCQPRCEVFALVLWAVSKFKFPNGATMSYSSELVVVSAKLVLCSLTQLSQISLRFEFNPERLHGASMNIRLLPNNEAGMWWSYGLLIFIPLHFLWLQK